MTALSTESADAHILVQLRDQREVSLPARVLIPSANGSYAYQGRFADVPQAAAGPVEAPAHTDRHPNNVTRARHSSCPAIAEELKVSIREVERVGLRVTKTISERVETVHIPLLEEHIEVQRIIVNQLVDAVPAVRYEGDVMMVH